MLCQNEMVHYLITINPSPIRFVKYGKSRQYLNMFQSFIILDNVFPVLEHLLYLEFLKAGF